ncbi:MmgE/PrpD family protein [Solwaraspora sp. WMMB335]|uniref:MmgE/PrpD family protein n=1 Tax=Solwaraspora sp. WMMB335 TaxID=3404118 RepID=UPI003B951392
MGVSVNNSQDGRLSASSRYAPTAEPIAPTVAEFAHGLAFADLPVDVVENLRTRLLDTLGVSIAALDLDTSRAALTYVCGSGPAQAHAIGLSDPVPAAGAAFANGVLAHSLDYDDTHLPSVLHPSATLVPTVLAAAERFGADDAKAMAALAAGIEICIRLGMAGYDPDSGDSVFFRHGQHATSICGTVGGAVAAAVLAGLDPPGIASAVGLAASMASGVIEANRSGGTVKRIHCGWAAQSAIRAAELSRAGFTGPPTVIEGRFGLLQAFLRDDSRPQTVVDGLGRDWLTRDLFVKPYPANHFLHAVIDAADALRRAGLCPTDVAEIVVLAPGPVIRTIGEPLAVKRAPQTGYQAQFSGPYAVTVGLLGGGGLGAARVDFSDTRVQDPVRRDIMAKVTVVEDPECTRVYPHQFPAAVRARTVDGRELVERVMYTRGGPERPLSPDELHRKFRDNVDGRLDPEARDRIIAVVARMGQDDPTIPGLMDDVGRASVMPR